MTEDEEYAWEKRKERKRRCCTGWTVCILVAVSVGIIIPVGFAISDWIIVYPEDVIRNPPPFRVDCHPDPNPNTEKCLQRGCFWSPSGISAEPSCIFPEGHGYRVTETVESDTKGQILKLKRAANGTLFGGDSEFVTLKVRYISPFIVQLKFYDESDPTRYEVPEDPPISPDNDLSNKSYDVVWRNHPQFGVLVRRRWFYKEGDYDMILVFDTRNPGFVFSSQFVQLPIRLPSANVFGLGTLGRIQLNHDMQWRTWTFWSRSAQSQISSEDSFGSNPFLMSLESDGKASGIFLRNSNAMEVVLQPEPAVVFRTTGGVLDFFVFLGPTPEAVIQQYMRIVGQPTLPPYWSLGFHFGRQHIGNLSNLESLLQDMIADQIPFDSIHLGDDILNKMISFSYDQFLQPSLKLTTDRLIRPTGRRMILSSWAGVAENSGISPYPAYEDAKLYNLLIHQEKQPNACQGRLFGTNVVYPDYSHPQAVDYWSTIVKKYRKEIAFDTLFLEKNPPMNEQDGCGGICNKNKWNHPPYVPAALRNTLHKNTLCADAQQKEGLHYNVHNLYGFYQARAAYKGFIKAFPNQRPLLLSQSNAPGIGRYAGHYIGGTKSDWADLQQSIIDMMQLNLVGIPLVGTDICGYYGNASETLCMRWTQAGAFYPFSRNYNYGDTRDQYPSAWSKMTVDKNREVLQLRYFLLPYLYTLFYLSSTSGGTVIRPLFHEFPSDNKTWLINDQFLWGPGILISPVVMNSGSPPTYLPDARWFYIDQGTEVQLRYGRTLPRTDLTVLVRGGHIIPMHSEHNVTSYNNHPYRIVVALDDRSEAEGFLYIDDREKPSTTQLMGSGILLKLELKNNIFKVRQLISQVDSSIYRELYIGTVEFWGLKTNPKQVLINEGHNCIPSFTSSGNCPYRPRDKILTIKAIKFMITQSWNAIRLEFNDDRPFKEDT